MNKDLFPALTQKYKTESIPEHNQININKSFELTDPKIKLFFNDLVLSEEDIEILNKLSYHEFCKLKSILFKNCYKNAGRKKKTLPIPIEDINVLHDSGVSYLTMAEDFGMSYKTLRLLLNEYEKNPDKEL